MARRRRRTQAYQLALALATIGLMAIGSFFLSLRYEKLDTESSAPNPSN